jgi:hypothetical protein
MTRLVLVWIFIFAACLVASGQDGTKTPTGILQVVIVDKYNARVSFASVRIYKRGKLVLNTLADDAGEIRIRLQAGKYSLNISRNGFRLFKSTVRIDPHQTTALEFSLKEIVFID